MTTFRECIQLCCDTAVVGLLKCNAQLTTEELCHFDHICSTIPPLLPLTSVAQHTLTHTSILPMPAGMHDFTGSNNKQHCMTSLTSTQTSHCCSLTAAMVRRSNTRQQYLQALALPYLFRHSSAGKQTREEGGGGGGGGGVVVSKIVNKKQN